MVTKYLTPPEKDGVGPVFESLLSVCTHLTNSGYKISKSKLYRDRDKGMIRINKDGTVLETEVRAYAATLERKNGDIGDLSDIHAQKAQVDVKVREEQYKKLKFARLRDEGKYLPRRDFEAELASRAVVMEAGFRQHYRLNVSRWIALVGGKREKTPEFMEELINGLEAQLAAYSNLDTFLVMYEGEKS